MQTAFNWEAASPPLPATPIQLTAAVRRPALPPAVDAAVWRGSELGRPATSDVVASGWPNLDAELPGGGWPQRCICEVLSSQPATVEWRLLSPSLRRVAAKGGHVVVIGPPRDPHVPGLVAEGLDDRLLVWIKAEKPAERLWVTEQVIKSGSAGAIVSWLTHARQEQLRRLQVCATGSDSLVFLCRPEPARHETSAAPLRVLASVGIDWELKVNVFKRRGPAHEGTVALPSVPATLGPLLTPRLRKPSRLISRESAEVVDAVGRTAVAPVLGQLSAVR